ncbi:MAG: glycosyltransferase family 2 protein [Betaproteobacteria bacterium]|nr:glycosyltransferase family 2 protein [Betaproteobacteria bacterium]NBY04550.1 glycosyltransferase family 2 protein [Betaproteobacteria bacterium]
MAPARPACPVSVIMITLNEGHRIQATLQALQWAQEIIVVDAGSTDDTVAVAQPLATLVVHHDWAGFGAQKNYALSLASLPWVLSLDADEFVTPELALEIQNFVAQNGNGFLSATLPRLSTYCGREMRHSGWWPDPVCRLFKRAHARFSDDLVHERIITTGPSAALEGLLLHDSFQNLDQVLHKLNQYSSEGALNLHRKGRTSSLGKAIGHGLWTFFRTYVFKLGFLDGREGFILAVSNAEGTYYRYLKLMYLCEQGPSNTP